MCPGGSLPDEYPLSRMASRVPAEQPVVVPETRRADAERNVQRIQEAAIRLWADEPNAGVADVAAAAGMLVAPRCTGTSRRANRSWRPSGPRVSPTARGRPPLAVWKRALRREALSRLLKAWLELGDRYRVVVANPSQPDNLPAREREERLGAYIYMLIERGQQAGEFSKDVPAVWGAAAVGSLLVAAITGVGEGRIRREDAHPLLTRSAVGVLRAG